MKSYLITKKVAWFRNTVTAEVSDFGLKGQESAIVNKSLVPGDPYPRSHLPIIPRGNKYIYILLSEAIAGGTM